MGNSPSKNDPLPKSSSSSANDDSSLNASNGNVDLDPDEGAPLSQTNKQEKNYNNKNKSTTNLNKADSLFACQAETNVVGPINITRGQSRSKEAKLQDTESFGAVSITSPIFDIAGADYKDEESLSSFNSSPVNGKSFGDNANSLNKLDSISECHPLDLSKKPKALSKENLQKHNKTVSTTLVKQSSTSSSNLSNSPSATHVIRKQEVDIDDIIKRLLTVKKNPNSRHYKDRFVIDTNDIKYIIGKSRQIFLEQPTLLRLSPSVKIVGDIHGQYFDLIRIFNCCGYPPQSNYLFLGDYVDRGEKSLETILLLLCYKIKYPENFFMLRGNHESANITKIYGFYDECKRRLNSNKLWKSFVDVFNTLPIAATINDKIFCVHGGLSPELSQFEQIANIKRPTDVPDKGLLADLLWSDPDPSVKNFSLTNWPKNDRGVSYCFGRKHVEYFCSKFKLDLIVRGHMVVEDGYEFFSRRKLVTIFSAPNYCGEFNNFGAVMSVDKNLYCSFELIKPN